VMQIAAVRGWPLRLHAHRGRVPPEPRQA
jgi:hypothetical protein